MSAEAVESGFYEPWQPDRVRQQLANHTIEDFIQASEVVIAVEVVSPRTRRRDRFAKPAEYAAAGIPFYWRPSTAGERFVAGGSARTA